MFLTDALLAVLYPQRCRICNDCVEQHRFGVACEACWQKTQILTDACAVGWYEGTLRESVLLLKREPHLPQHLVEILIQRARSLDSITRIIPVPLHKDRMRTRGFNQASVIGREVSRELRVPLDDASLVRVSSPEKYRAGLDAKGRQETVAKAFVVRYPRLIEGEEILLVDDVFTTGATVAACTEVLVDAGAKSVFVLTLARAR